MIVFIRGIAAVVRKAPVWVVVTAVALTLAAVAANAIIAPTISTGNEGFAPDTPEIKASERISELFGSEAANQVIQVVVRDPAGGPVVSAGGFKAVDQIAAVLYAEVSDKLVDSGAQPAVVSFLAPVEQAALMGQVDPTLLGVDVAVQEVYRQAMADPNFPAEQRGYMEQLLNGPPEEASAGLVLVFVSAPEDLDPDMAWEQLMDQEAPVAAAIRSVEVEGIEILPFSFNLLFEDQDQFLGEIGTLFAGAASIILIILLLVYWLKGRGARWVGPLGLVLGLAAFAAVWFGGSMSGAGGLAAAAAAGLIVFQLTRMFVGLLAGDRGLAAAGRRPLADAFLTLVTIGMAIAWMQGVGAVLLELGILGSMSEVTQIVPILMIGLGVDYAIHVTHRYREQVGHGDDVVKAMGRSIGTVGVALTLATVTTAIGFLTNVFNPVPALKDFGILCAVGIVSSFVLMLTFVPAVRMMLDLGAERHERLPVEAIGSSGENVLSKVVVKVSLLAEHVPALTVVVALVLGGMGFWGYTNLETRFSFTDFLPEDSPAVSTLEILQQEFGGGFGETTQVLVESADGSSLASGDVHNAMVDFSLALAEVDKVVVINTPEGDFAQVRSPVSVLAQLLAPAVNGGPAASPELLALVGQLGMGPDLKVPEGTDVSSLYSALAQLAPLGSVAHFEGDAMDAVLFEVSTQAGEAGAMKLKEDLSVAFAPLNTGPVTAIAVSTQIISAEIVNSLAASQTNSLYLTLAAATFILMLSFWFENRRPMLGFITMLPVALVVLWTYGLMYATGIPFGPVTATLAALAIGIGVPFTIHIARRFEEDRVRFDSLDDALRSTTRHTGAALAGSAFTTMAGFGILVTSSLVPFQQMGQVTAYAIGLSLIGALLVLPSLLALWEGWHRRRGDLTVSKATESVVD